MSIRLMTVVWDIPWPSQSALLVALKLADHGNDNGRMIRPSRQRLADSSLTSLATVKRVLADFVEHEVLMVVKRGGSGPGHTTEYAFNMRTLLLLSEGVIRLSGSPGEVTKEQLKPIPDGVENKGLTVSLLSEKAAQDDEQAAQNDEISGSHAEPQTNHLEPSLRTKKESKFDSSVKKTAPKAAPLSAAEFAAALNRKRVAIELHPRDSGWWDWMEKLPPRLKEKAAAAGRIIVSARFPWQDGATFSVPDDNVQWQRPSAMPSKGGAA